MSDHAAPTGILTLAELRAQGRLGIDYYAVITVWRNENKAQCLEWLTQNLLARLPVESTAENANWIFLGPPGCPRTKVSVGEYRTQSSHFALLAVTQEDFRLASELLEGQGFECQNEDVHASNRWFRLYFNESLGLAAHLAWRSPESIPVDPATVSANEDQGGQQELDFEKPEPSRRELGRRADLLGERDDDPVPEDDRDESEQAKVPG